jgi:hypothetical protein
MTLSLLKLEYSGKLASHMRRRSYTSTFTTQSTNLIIYCRYLSQSDKAKADLQAAAKIGRIACRCLQAPIERYLKKEGDPGVGSPINFYRPETPGSINKELFNFSNVLTATPPCLSKNLKLFSERKLNFPIANLTKKQKPDKPY